MAGRTKAQIEEENNVLKVKLENLEKMMNKLMDAENSNNKEENIGSVDIDNNIEDGTEDIIEIKPNQLIHVTNLFTGIGLSLTGMHGNNIRFIRFGQTMPITYSDLTYICSNQRKFADEGYFYINNKDFIKINYLQEEYEKIISAKEIEGFINLSTDEMEKTYNKVTELIKESIIDIVVKGIIDNKPEYGDRNKIEFISKLRGKDLEIIAKNYKEYNTK